MIAGENDESVFQLAASLERSKHPAWPFVTSRMFGLFIRVRAESEGRTSGDE